MRDVELAWYVGLDAEGTRIGDALWNGEGLDNTSQSGVVEIYRLTFKDADVVFEEIKGEPVYLILAMTPDKVLRMKPQKSVDRIAGAAIGGGYVSSVMPLMRIPVGVILERRKTSSLWTDVVWRPTAILGGLPDAEPWTVLGSEAETTTFFAGVADIELYRTETDNYRSNLASAAPSVWVALYPTGGEPPYEIAAVTADPAEGEALTEPAKRSWKPWRCPCPCKTLLPRSSTSTTSSERS